MANKKVEVYAHYMTDKAIKIAKKFTATTNSRPMLNNVFFGKDGTAIATNSHIAVRMYGAHEYKEDLQFITKQNILVRNEHGPELYPVMEKIFENKAEVELVLEKEGAKAIVEMLKAIVKVGKVLRSDGVTGAGFAVIMYKEKDSSDLIFVMGESMDSSVEFKISIDEEVKGKAFHVALTTDYLIKCLEAVIEYGTKNEVKIIIENQHTQVLIEGEGIKTVVLPRRNYSADEYFSGGSNEG